MHQNDKSEFTVKTNSTIDFLKLLKIYTKYHMECFTYSIHSNVQYCKSILYLGISHAAQNQYHFQEVFQM